MGVCVCVYTHVINFNHNTISYFLLQTKLFKKRFFSVYFK